MTRTGGTAGPAAQVNVGRFILDVATGQADRATGARADQRDTSRMICTHSEVRRRTMGREMQRR